MRLDSVHGLLALWCGFCLQYGTSSQEILILHHVAAQGHGFRLRVQGPGVRVEGSGSTVFLESQK